MDMTRMKAGAKAQGQLRAAVVGHVDHGKSTVVGRLLHETDSLPQGKVEAVAEMCRRRGMPFEWAFVTDALQAERDQGITIDSSHIPFRSALRDYVLIDAPGHREFIKNMISGSSDCDAALVVIDAGEGVRDQSRRHGFLLHLLGIRQIAVAVTKMDTIGYDADRFATVEREFREALGELGVTPGAVIPVSGRDGDNIAAPSGKMGWYDGPTVVGALDGFEVAAPATALPLRIPVQDVYRFDERRIVAGRIESGRLRVGDTVLFSPSNHTAVVKTIESWPRSALVEGAEAGDSIGFTLEEQIFVERGEIVSHAGNAPVETNVFRARVFWMGAEPLRVGKRYTLRHNTAEAIAEVESIERVIDAARMDRTGTEEVACDCVADVVMRAQIVLALDPAADNPRTGRIVLADGFDIVGGGLIDMAGYPDQRQVMTRRSTNITEVEHRVSREERTRRIGHAGGVLWFTGLSGAGKSTLAIELERQLFARGYNAYVLDGDNLRHGLNANLGFSPEDRAENIRRVGEVAALMAEIGTLVISAFISPYRDDRLRARKAVGTGFHEVFIDAGLAECERRDTKGLYARARAGEIANFTGISAPYEPPESCELVVDTANQPVEESVDALIRYVEEHFPLVKPRR
jgi:bifunctional enzyme CysN/CysC